MVTTDGSIDFSDLGDASNVLLLGSSMDDTVENVCAELVRDDSLDAIDFLSVTLTDTPDERLEQWTRHADGNLPATFGFVTTDDQSRSTVAQSSASLQSPTETNDICIRTVSDPGDLTSLGVAITKFLSDWTDDGNHIELCFHSLTTLLQYVDLKPTYKFLHTLSGQLAQSGATAHYHLDPGVHSEKEINLITSLMDAVVEVTEDGEFEVKTR